MLTCDSAIRCCRFYHDEAATVISNELTRLSARVAELEGTGDKLVTDLDNLIKDSRGVDGLHKNGDIATWQELCAGGWMEEWLGSLEAARAALAKGKS
jgi:phage-related minor tail protein